MTVMQILLQILNNDILSHAIPQVTALVELHLRSNRAGDVGMETFAGVLKDDPGSSRIESLYLDANNFSEDAGVWKLRYRESCRSRTKAGFHVLGLKS